eukprot:2585117-Rhodomonas_salina.2
MRRKPPVRYTTRVLGLFRVKGQGLALSLCRELDSQTADRAEVDGGCVWARTLLSESLRAAAAATSAFLLACGPREQKSGGGMEDG